jgi:hypothetical protein
LNFAAIFSGAKDIPLILNLETVSGSIRKADKGYV